MPIHDNCNKMSVILASRSATRADLLTRAGVRFSIQPSIIDEATIKNSMRSENRTPSETAQVLSDLKASSVSEKHPTALVIGSDQMLALNEVCLDKPTDLINARQQLVLLRGQTHHLLSAVSVARQGSVIWRFCADSELTMRDFSNQFLEHYLQSERARICESVGGYKLEGLGIQLFSSIDGMYFDILGLPLVALLDFLRKKGVVAE